MPSAPPQGKGTDEEAAQRSAQLERQLAESAGQIAALRKQLAELGRDAGLNKKTLMPVLKRKVANALAADGSFEVRVCGAAYGHALPKLLDLLGARMVIVSTPEFGGPPDPRDGRYRVPVMSALERVADFVVPLLYPGYDFKASASAQDCAAQVPDRDLVAADWARPEMIEITQWFRYWGGRVRSGLAATLLMSPPAARDLVIYNGTGGGILIPKGGRVAFAVSFSGGHVTQTERRALPRLINGTVSDLSARDLDLGSVTIVWLHFETLEDYLKALQGYGGIDYGGDVVERSKFDLPGRWIDGPYNAAHDLLRGVPGATPEERRAFLLAPQPPSPAQLSRQLHKAIAAKDVARVRQLLGLAADNAPLPPGAREPLCADPNAWTAHGFPMLVLAAAKFNLEAMEALLAAGADPRQVNFEGFCALSAAVHFATRAPAEAEGVAERVAAVIERCAQAQLGTSYAAHVASLTVGAAVTWTTKLNWVSKAGDFAGTIVEVDDTFWQGRGPGAAAARADENTRVVKGAKSGKQTWFNPGMLRLAVQYVFGRNARRPAARSEH
eukprot:COSAG03_NODE_2078_length_3151_cov_4.109764_2_plen_556_part_00